MSDRIARMDVRLAEVEARLAVMEEGARPKRLPASEAEIECTRAAVQDLYSDISRTEAVTPKFSLWFRIRALFGLVTPAAGFESSLWRGR